MSDERQDQENHDTGRGSLSGTALVDKDILLTEGEFDIYEKSCFTILSAYLNDSNGKRVFPSVEVLMAKMPASKPKVIAALKGLEEKGMLTKTKVKASNGIHYRNEYYLHRYDKSREQNIPKTTPRKKKEDDIPSREILEYFNFKAERDINTQRSDAVSAIKMWWKKGYRMEDFKMVIDLKAKEWKGNPKAKQNNWLDPKTLFRLSNFEGYLDRAKELASKRGKTADNLRYLRQEDKPKQNDEDFLVEVDGKTYDMRIPEQKEIYVAAIRRKVK